jgi:diguanylate cyclase (GGDEF)-like protein/PAS domain S-box-containing protein
MLQPEARRGTAGDDSWFAALAETATVAIFVYRGTILYCNRATEALTGYAADELARLPVWHVVHPEHQELVRRRGEARLRGEPVPNQYEFKLLTKKGQERWVDFTASTIQFEGAPAGLGICVDVTERKRVELALRESEERLKLAQSAAGSMVWDWDLETDRLTVSDSAAELYGVAPDDVARTGKEWMDLVHPDDRDLLRDAVLRVLRQGEDLSIDVRFVVGGSVRWLAERARGIRLPSGRVERLIGVAHDITERKRAEEVLREREEKYRELVENQADLLIKLDPAGRLTFASPAFCSFFGKPAEEWVGQEVFGLGGHSQAAAIEAFLAAMAQPPHAARLETRERAGDGSWRWIAWAGTGVVEPDGELREIVAVGRDITDRKLAEDALYQEKERAQVTLASIGDGVIRTDAGGRIDYLNPVAERLTGWRTADAYGRQVPEVFNVVDAVTRKPLPDAVGRCLREERIVTVPGERLLLRADGAEFAVRDSAAPIRDRAGKLLGSVLVFKDLTELRGVEREINFLASYDPLTGLLNRREFEQTLRRALTTARADGMQHAVCYLDLDEFKVVNDTCGHIAGDELLKRIGALLQWKAPEGVTLARLGGDEFGILIENRPLSAARRIAEDLRREIAGFRFHWQDRVHETRVSIGLVPIGPDSPELDGVLSAADAACYVAKESGRNRIHQFQPDDTALAERYGEMQWIHRLQEAFRDERFRLYHQPIRCLTDPGESLSEIFVRLVDERGDLVSPAAFIPAAERYHLISALDRWVVRHAFQSLRQVRPAARPMGFAINLSGQSLGEETFLDYVVGQLNESGVAPQLVCFEITETAAIGNLGGALSFIAVLRGMGCRFVLDDFGSGLSSFAYLKNLPVDFLKVAGEFVRDLADDPIHRALVSSINQIGHVLGLRTIAEAVEDERTLAVVRELGVDYAQGYWIARPEPLA